ncbi:MAG: glycoside hydrolase family 88 protein [Clostridiales bacterium]|nr:glycoside hydrolase family 88 protein [Clostridiales bacterium]
MSNYKEPISYGKASCDTMMRKYKAKELPPEGRFHYHQGVFLSGMYKTYELCGDEKYFTYIKEWVDSIIDENGNINKYDPGQLDDIQPGILLFPLLDKTGDMRYQKALDELLMVVKKFPRNGVGGFWHKEWYPNQMWLDGLYMAGPICAEYAKRYNKPEFTDIVVEQAILMNEKTKDEKTGLLYHAWDYSKEEDWADPETGLSPEFWGRSIGWVPVAILDDLDYIDEKQEGYDSLCEIVRELLIAVCNYQSDSGLWYQVIDKMDEKDNWLETSCSSLFVAAICKAVRKGILDASYLAKAKKGFEGVIDSLKWEGDNLIVGNVCIGTGVGDYKHYIERPVSENDLHGVGAFLIMCAEVQMVYDRIY